MSQTQVALSMTEAEYIVMSMSLRDVISVMNLIDELKTKKCFGVICRTQPHLYCKVFENNYGALELTCLKCLLMLCP